MRATSSASWPPPSPECVPAGSTGSCRFRLPPALPGPSVNHSRGSCAWPSGTGWTRRVPATVPRRSPPAEACWHRPASDRSCARPARSRDSPTRHWPASSSHAGCPNCRSESRPDRQSSHRTDPAPAPPSPKNSPASVTAASPRSTGRHDRPSHAAAPAAPSASSRPCCLPHKATAPARWPGPSGLPPRPHARPSPPVPPPAAHNPPTGAHERPAPSARRPCRPAAAPARPPPAPPSTRHAADLPATFHPEYGERRKTLALPFGNRS